MESTTEPLHYSLAIPTRDEEPPLTRVTSPPLTALPIILPRCSPLSQRSHPGNSCLPTVEERQPSEGQRHSASHWDPCQAPLPPLPLPRQSTAAVPFPP